MQATDFMNHLFETMTSHGVALKNNCNNLVERLTIRGQVTDPSQVSSFVSRNDFGEIIAKVYGANFYSYTTCFKMQLKEQNLFSLKKCMIMSRGLDFYLMSTTATIQ